MTNSEESGLNGRGIEHEPEEVLAEIYSNLVQEGEAVSAENLVSPSV